MPEKSGGPRMGPELMQQMMEDQRAIMPQMMER